MVKKYRVAVIGSTGRGDYGHALESAWTKVPNAEVVAITDDNESGLKKTGEKLGVDALFADYRKMLDKTMPDIVTVCPRWIDQHYEMASAAIEVGAHVYMEKPVCRNLKEADDLVKASEQAHVKVAIAHPTRYSPKLRLMKQMIDEGAIGQVLEYRGRGKEDHRGGGEDLWVLGTHILDMILALGGHPTWCFAHVTQEGKPAAAADIREGNEGIGWLVGDAVRAMFGMPDASTATFYSYKDTQGKPSRYALQVYGSEGILEIREGTMPPLKYLADSSWAPGRSKKEWQNVTTAGVDKDEVLKDPKYKDRHYLAVTDLIAAIEEDRQPLCNIYEARKVVEMITAVFASHYRSARLALPLENREDPLAKLKQGAV